MKLVFGISGASGAPYARRMLEHLRALPSSAAVSVELVLSRTAEQVWQLECGGSPRELGYPAYGGREYDAACASGSARYDAMLILPASMSCIARIAHGISDDLLTRAADVMLKERRRLIVVPREAPYSAIHLENMLALTRAGGMVMPASPSFYTRPQTLPQALDTVLARILDQLEIAHELTKRWGEPSSPASPRTPHQQER